MDSGYRLTPAAEADIEGIWRHSAETWSEGQADRYLDALLASFETLVAFPCIARERTEFTPPIRVHPSGVHVVIYLAEGQGVTILRVLHMRQDLLSALDG